MVNVRVDAPRAVETSHAVAGDADEVRAELTRLSRAWDTVVSRWSGDAAASYATLWEDWHDGAVQLVERLARSSQLLEHAAKAYDEQEAASGRAVRSVPARVDL